MKSSSMTIDDICADLHVIGSIPENGRLRLINGQLSTEPNYHYSIASWAKLALRRWWNHDKRSHTIMALQNIILRVSVLRSLDKGSMLRLESLSIKAIQGIEHLKKTYEDDSSTQSRLTMIQERLELIVRDIIKDDQE